MRGVDVLEDRLTSIAPAERAVGIETISHLRLEARSSRVAWLLPVIRGYYWQPVLREFTKIFPDTTIFTSDWTGFLPGYEGTFRVKLLPGYRQISIRHANKEVDRGYEGFQLAPSSIIRELSKFHPNVVFTSAFGVWTAYALAYKIFTHSRLIVLLDGVSDRTTYKNSAVRFRSRRLMGRILDSAACNSEAGCNYLVDEIKIKASKIFRLRFLVPDIQALQSDLYKKLSDREPSVVNFLFVGQIIERKGWKYLLKAVSLLLAKGLRGFSVNMVGDGAERNELLDQIKSLGFVNIVNFVGMVPYNCLGAYYEASDVFVLPALEDVWGMVIPEAMAFGKAVLCSRFAGACELVEPGVNGYVMDPRDPIELAGYMEQFIREPELAARLGTNARKCIASDTAERAAENLCRLALGANYGIETP